MPGQTIIHWNTCLLDIVRNSIEVAPTRYSRVGAILQTAMFDAVNGLETPRRFRQYASHVPPDPQAESQLSAAYAASYILRQTVAAPDGPPQAQLNTELGKHKQGPFATRNDLINDCWTRFRNGPGAQSPGPGTPGDQHSQSYGEAVAQAILDARSNDRADCGDDPPAIPVPDATNPGCGPGDWRPTPPIQRPPVGPQWGKVCPFGVRRIRPFMARFPFRNARDTLRSTEYARQHDEVRRLGAAEDIVLPSGDLLPVERNVEQTKIAFFWANDVNPTYLPPGHLFEITQIVALSQGTTSDLVNTARLFALVAIGMADAAIVAWYAKWLYEDEDDCSRLIRLWRPETAIQMAYTDGNVGTVTEPRWKPLSLNPNNDMHFSPQFPAWTSGHATFAAAHATMMRLFYGQDNIAFDARTDDVNYNNRFGATDPTRHYESFTEAALENGRSRVYLGVHYQWDANGGFDSGRAVAMKGFMRMLQPIPTGTAGNQTSLDQMQELDPLLEEIPA